MHVCLFFPEKYRSKISHDACFTCQQHGGSMLRFHKNSANDKYSEDRFNDIRIMFNNYWPPLCRLTIAVIIISYIGHRAGATADNDTQRHLNRLMPRFLNGHYVTWPAKDDGTESYCDADGPAPKPPPHVYYVPDNVVFTRMQMAGDRAFIVSPRYKYVHT